MQHEATFFSFVSHVALSYRIVALSRLKWDDSDTHDATFLKCHFACRIVVSYVANCHFQFLVSAQHKALDMAMRQNDTTQRHLQTTTDILKCCDLMANT